MAQKTPDSLNLLVVGAGGRLGQLLRGAWTARDQDSPQLIFAGRSPGLDLLIDADSLPGAVPPCDVVVGLWGVTSGNDTELARNADLAEASLTLARRSGASRVFHLSSAAVYGPGQSLRETDPLAPKEAYGRAKCALEARVAELSDPTVAQCCLRLANVVGADSLAPALNAPRDEPAKLTRFEDGQGPRRSYIGPDHLIEVLLGLSRLPGHALPDVVNVAASDPVEMQTLLHLSGHQINWIPATAHHNQHVSLCTDRLAALLPDLSLHNNAAQMITDWRRAKEHS